MGAPGETSFPWWIGWWGRLPPGCTPELTSSMALRNCWGDEQIFLFYAQSIGVTNLFTPLWAKRFPWACRWWWHRRDWHPRARTWSELWAARYAQPTGREPDRRGDWRNPLVSTFRFLPIVSVLPETYQSPFLSANKADILLWTKLPQFNSSEI